MKSRTRGPSLNLTAPLLTSIPLPSSTQITTLNLSHNNISLMHNLHKLKHLVILNLSFNKISKVQNIFGLQELQELHLSNNLIEYLPKQMTGLKKLRVVDVSNNKILYVHGISCLEGMELEVCKVEGNRVVKRPKFLETMEKILGKKEMEDQQKNEDDDQMGKQEKTNDEILEQDYVRAHLSNQTTLQKTLFLKQGQTALFSNIELLGTFRSITQLTTRPTAQNQEFECQLQVKDKWLFNKKNQILSKYSEIKQFPSQIDRMIEEDRPSMDSQTDIVKTMAKYMLDVQIASRQMVDKVMERVDDILTGFQSCNMLERQTGLQQVLDNKCVDHRKLLLDYLELDGREEGTVSVDESIGKVKEYLSAMNSLKENIHSLDFLVGEYVNQFNRLYKVIELKTLLQDPFAKISSTISEKQHYENVVTTLEQQIDIKNEIEQELIKENNILLEKVDGLTQQNSRCRKEIEKLKNRWIVLEEMKEEGNILLDEVIQKQHGVASLMQEKLSGDMFQSIILNQAKTIELLLNANKSIVQKVYTQELFDKGHLQSNFIKPYITQPCSNQNLQTNIQSVKKRIGKEIKSYECSADSNLLSDRPYRNYTQVELPACPISYFSKSVNLLKSKSSQPTTYRNSYQNTKYIATSYRDGDYGMFENTVGRRMILDEEKDQTEGYRQYLRYYLRNNIVETLIEKSTHRSLKQRYSDSELRVRKFKQITGKKVLRKQFA